METLFVINSTADNIVLFKTPDGKEIPCQIFKDANHAAIIKYLYDGYVEQKGEVAKMYYLMDTVIGLIESTRYTVYKDFAMCFMHEGYSDQVHRALTMDVGHLTNNEDIAKILSITQTIKNARNRLQ